MIPADAPMKSTMPTTPPLQGVTSTYPPQVTYDDSWARRQVVTLYHQLGTWRAVAAALAPFHQASATGWWQLARGRPFGQDKINALLAHAGIVPINAAYPKKRTRKHYKILHLSLNDQERLTQLETKAAELRAFIGQALEELT